MKRILLVVNQKEAFGGISQQVNILQNKVNGYEDFSSEVFSIKGSLIRRVYNFFKLIIYSRKFDVLHIHGCSYWGFVPIAYGIIAGKILRKKVLITFHGGEAERYLKKYPFLTSLFLKKADRILVPSGYLQSVFENNGYKVDVIPNIIEVQSKESFKQVINPKFITIRSLEPIYNIELAIKAFEIISAEYVNAELIILGDGSQKNILQEYVKSKMIKKISFQGNVPNTDVLKYMNHSDILLNTPFTDNMPLSILEAFASGLLVISSNVGGVPYMIEHLKNGLLFESNSVEDLSNKIRLALNDQERSIEMIIKAKKEMKNYTWDEIKGKLFKLYSEKK